MTRTLLVLGPASVGKSTLIQSLAAEHPDHHWHLVALEPAEQDSSGEPRQVEKPGWAGLWRLPYRGEDVLTALPDLVRQIQGASRGEPLVIAFEGKPVPLLRHAYTYDVRVFIAPPIHEEGVLFRSNDQARLALRQILRDSSTFAAQVLEAGHDMEAEEPDGLALGGGVTEVRESQVEEFLGQPLGTELAVRVHLQPGFEAMADADIIILNTSAGESFSEDNVCWQRLLGLFGRLRKSRGRAPLLCACDLGESEDPCFVRIRRRISEVLCKI